MNSENTTARACWAVLTGAVIASAMVLIHGIRWQATVSAASSLHESVPTFLAAGGAAWAVIIGLVTYAAIAAVARIRQGRRAPVTIDARDIAPDFS